MRCCKRQATITDIKYAYVGDKRSNMGHSLLIVGYVLGMGVRICGPKSLWPSENYRKVAEDLAEKSGARLLVTDDPKAAVKGVDCRMAKVEVAGNETPGRLNGAPAIETFNINPTQVAGSGRPIAGR